MNLLRALVPALALTAITSAAWADPPRAAAPPPPLAAAAPPPAAAAPPPAGYAPPPAGYAPPPAGYAPPPAGYAPPPAGYAPPPGGYYGPPGQVPYPMYAAPMAAGPRMLPYEEGDAVPPGYHLSLRARSGLVVGGAVTFGVTYLLSLTVGGLSGEYALAAPVVGPFIEIGRLNSGSGSGTAAVILVLDGLAQAGGVAMLIGGLASKKKVLMRDDVAKGTWHVTPMVLGQGSMGVGIVGSM